LLPLSARAWPPVAAFEEEPLPHPERQEREHREVFIQPGGGKKAERPSEAVERRRRTARPSAVLAKPAVQAGAESGGGEAGRMTAQRAGGRPAGGGITNPRRITTGEQDA